MPRKSRIDAPGALHHIIARGIERKAVFQNEKDGKDFLERLETNLEGSRTPCYAWALLPNHFHLLLHTGATSISMVLRRVLTGLQSAEVLAAGKYQKVIVVRSLVCFWAVRELGISQTRLARMLRISQPAVSAAVTRSEQLAKDHNFRIDE